MALAEQAPTGEGETGDRFLILMPFASNQWVMEFEYDRVRDRSRVYMALFVKDPASGKTVARVPIETTKPNDKTTAGSIDIDPKFAMSCDVDISECVGTIEGRLIIPLKLFVDEMNAKTPD